MLRPRPTRWFEILCARDDATLVLEALARTGAVELEARGGAATPADLGEIMPLLAQFAELAARYRAYWPAPQACRPSPLPEAPVPTLQRCLNSLRGWAQPAEPLIRALQRVQTERGEWQLWQRVLDAMPPGPLDPGRLAGAGPLVPVRLFVLGAGADPSGVLPPAGAGLELLGRTLLIDDRPHLLVAGRPDTLQALAQRVASQKGSMHEVPPWLGSDAEANRLQLQQRLQALAADQARLDGELQTLARQHALACVLGDAFRVQWVIHNVAALETGGLFCWITGWSSDAGGELLSRALQESRARALLHHAPPPESCSAPLLLSNPAWARPFEIFSRALGMPAAAEADPTPLLALVVPLMFGYMFGDVGQGLVIAAAGWWYRRRFAIARLLMVGGLSAAVFGVLFGSVFSLHGLLPALWLHPLDRPLVVLLAPLLGGAVLLALGLVLDALAAGWRGEMRRWLLTDAALLGVYLALLAAFVDARALWVAAAGAAYFCIGHGLQARRWPAAFGAIGELVEKTLQIMINTLSFARVGAFALAHAGLSSAIVALMAAADSIVARALVLVIGNLVIMVLEVMVVSIQTTRLVLFEFFTRFMQGRGRAFRPLLPPPFGYQEP
jgi:V/A-type H+/Na+-transporting ATPase subunit I